jgi:hypothetical protein
MDKENMIFCPYCSYGEMEIMREYALYDFYCPSCRMTTLSKFYSYGSVRHKEKWEEWIIRKSRTPNAKYFKHKPISYPYEKDK